jgi:hypothetical protein
VVAAPLSVVEGRDVARHRGAADDRTKIVGCDGATLAIAAANTRRAAHARREAAHNVAAYGRIGARRAAAAGAGRSIRAGFPHRAANAAARLTGRATGLSDADRVARTTDVVAAGVERRAALAAAQLAGRSAAIPIVVANPFVAATVFANRLPGGTADIAGLAVASRAGRVAAA